MWIHEVGEIVFDPAGGCVPDDGAGGLVDDLFGDVGAVITDEDGLVDDGVEFEGGIDAHSAIGDADLSISGDEFME